VAPSPPPLRHCLSLRNHRPTSLPGAPSTAGHRGKPPHANLSDITPPPGPGPNAGNHHPGQRLSATLPAAHTPPPTTCRFLPPRTFFSKSGGHGDGAPKHWKPRNTNAASLTAGHSPHLKPNAEPPATTNN
jgi:hypothetical protein